MIRELKEVLQQFNKILFTQEYIVSDTLLEKEYYWKIFENIFLTWSVVEYCVHSLVVGETDSISLLTVK